jgi:hypothetical protein
MTTAPDPARTSDVKIFRDHYITLNYSGRMKNISFYTQDYFSFHTQNHYSFGYHDLIKGFIYMQSMKHPYNM